MTICSRCGDTDDLDRCRRCGLTKVRRRNKNAVALGHLGGSKGGKARAASLTKEQRVATAKRVASIIRAKGLYTKDGAVKEADRPTIDSLPPALSPCVGEEYLRVKLGPERTVRVIFDGPAPTRSDIRKLMSYLALLEEDV